MDGAFKVLGPIFAVGLVLFGIYYWATNNPGIAVLLILGVVALASIPFIWENYTSKKRIERMLEGMPVEGPMQVNLNTIQSGGEHYLKIDVKMTKADWDAINQAGLLGHTLFSYPHPKWPDVTSHYATGHLPHTKLVKFPNAIDADDAKNELVSSLQSMRTRIEQQKNYVARPAERVEKLEI